MECAMWSELVRSLRGRALHPLVCDFARAAADLQLDDGDLREFSSLYARLLAVALAQPSARSNVVHQKSFTAGPEAIHADENEYEEDNVAHELEFAIEQLRKARFTLILCENESSY